MEEYSLQKIGLEVLETNCPYQKADKTIFASDGYKNGIFKLKAICEIPPDYPARTEKPELISPSRMPKRSTGEKGMVKLLHALAHIELNAIDLAWDMLVRFGDRETMPKEFFEDWLKVAYEESLHFKMLAQRLKDFNAEYGDFPAHSGLWEAAEKTKDNLGARLAVVPMVLEARGLDVTPKMIEQLQSAGDIKTSDLLKRIYNDEITHVYIGVKWFEYVVKSPISEAVHIFHNYLREFFRGKLIPPFNIPARDKAMMPQKFYLDYEVVVF